MSYMHDCDRVHISLIVLAVLTDRDSDSDDELELDDHSLFEMSTLSFCHDSSHLISTLVSILFDRVALMKIIHSH